MTISALSDDIDAFVAPLVPFRVETVGWRGGQMKLEVSVYLTNRPAPDELVTSGRCIVLAGDAVLVMTNPGGEHVLPGGRRKGNESALEAAVREVREETGLVIEAAGQVAVLLYRHLTPRPAIYPYPYPWFANTVYVARLPQAVPVSVNDTYELAGKFLPIASARPLIPGYQQALLVALT